MAEKADTIEALLIRKIVNGDFPNGTLPLSEKLAEELGVSRTLVRETLKKLESYGFIHCKRGRPCAINDFWINGNLLTLAKIVEHVPGTSSKLIQDLLEIRPALMETLIYNAVKNHPQELMTLLGRFKEVSSPEEFTSFDWELHKKIAQLSKNRIAPLIINSFEGLFKKEALRYFQHPKAREVSKRFYAELCDAVMAKDPQKAASLTRRVMEESAKLWRSMR